MGQSPQSKTHKNQDQIQTSMKYDVDLHLIEPDSVLPSTFSSPVQKIIGEIEQLVKQIDQHPIEKYLINSLQQRFDQISQINSQAFHQGRDFTLTNKRKEHSWSELITKQSFLLLINKLQKTYYIESKILQEYERQINSIDKNSSDINSFDTLRKQSLADVKVGSDIDQGLIMRLIFYYYIKMFKLNINTNSQIIMKFHKDTGRMLCLLIFNQYMDTQQLFEIFYQLVCVDKHGESMMKQKMSDFHQRYHPMCLKYSHSINLSSTKMQAMQTATRIYLDELYLKSLEEAEDPEIKDTDDSLMPIKVFPISRVKDKQKV